MLKNQTSGEAISLNLDREVLSTSTVSSAWYSRVRLGSFIYSNRVQFFIIGVILLNAVVLGMETSPGLIAQYGEILHLLDRICLSVFIVEILLKLYADRLKFFRSSWNVFDFIIVGIALVPGAETFAVLRALRALRVLRLISVIPALRRVVTGLVKAVPGLLSVGAVLIIIFYVSAIIATMLFGAEFPEEFGDLGRSLFTLFQIMTLDNWSVINRIIWDEVAWAPLFFVPFILISSLTVLNLFVAVVVDAMQQTQGDEEEPSETTSPELEPEPTLPAAAAQNETQQILTELQALRHEVAALRFSTEHPHQHPGNRQASELSEI